MKGRKCEEKQNFLALGKLVRSGNKVFTEVRNSKHDGRVERYLI